MIYHRIHTYHGTAPVPSPDGRPIYCYRALCGAEVFSLTQFPQGKKITIGKAPHVECAKCFPLKASTPNDHVFPVGLDTPVYDEQGKLAKIESTNEMGVPTSIGSNDRSHRFEVRKEETNDPTVGRVIDDSGLGELTESSE